MFVESKLKYGLIIATYQSFFKSLYRMTATSPLVIVAAGMKAES